MKIQRTSARTRTPLWRSLLPALLLGVVPGAGCAGSAAEVAPPEAPAVAPHITATRPINEVPRRTIGFLEQGVWISNELDGGRVGDAWMEGDSVVVLRIAPENAPVNNSAWYAFKIWSSEPRTVRLRLTYEDGRHRYWPQVRRAGEAWAPLDSAAVTAAPTAATLRLAVGPDTTWVAGQPLLTSSYFERWTDSLAALPHVARETFATSPRGRPLHMLAIGRADAGRHVFLIGRQHPPEVTGSLAMFAFVEELAGASPLARRFREEFRVHVVPLVNPDGVDLGHWRHNTGGVDLNRDWEAFNQPETRATRDAFRGIMNRSGGALWFAADFHSTHRDVFYTLDRALETEPAGVIDRWLYHIDRALPHYTVSDSPSGLGTPTSRNWFYREFGAAALTYEVGDRTEHALIREVAVTAARGTMEILLDELAQREGE